MSGSQLAQLDAGARKLDVFRYTYIAAAAVAGYEYFVNFDNEVRYLWGKRRFSFSRALLFLCRYLPLVQGFEGLTIYVLPPSASSSCRALIAAETILITIQFVVSTSVLYYRAYAVWGFRRNLAIFLTILFLAGVGAISYVGSLTLSSVQILPYRLGNGCFASVRVDAAKYTLFKIIFDDTLALALLMYRAIEQTNFIRDFRTSGARANLLIIMTRDGVFYFFLNLAITIANICLFGVVQATWKVYCRTSCVRDYYFTYSLQTRRPCSKYAVLPKRRSILWKWTE
ncbi:hypothetical protein SCHPADRAFT_678546 [Schizopora paradoxa]|uniref:DUF6533 domain-containing protein n=1 Tax=Schizopora paradoxa TaxID=27342 RepID=A0A0H2R611_9AGAM|nr:hypothetical protein SCHPADRAFT_678546 [Schizopora paradoxa]